MHYTREIERCTVSDSETIYYDDESKDKQINPIKEKFEKIKYDISELDCMLEILLTALDNEFEQPTIKNMETYLFLFKNLLQEHRINLDKFYKDLSIPDKSANVLSLKYIKFSD